MKSPTMSAARSLDLLEEIGRLESRAVEARYRASVLRSMLKANPPGIMSVSLLDRLSRIKRRIVETMREEAAS